MVHHRCCQMLMLGALFLSSTQMVVADGNWPRWRGPNQDGHSTETNIPIKWSSQSVVWKTALKGQGQSSPVIWGHRIFLTTALQRGKQRVVYCVDRTTGKIVWERIAWKGVPEKSHKMNGWASATCTTDGERVYAFFGKGGLHCYHVDGTHVWSRELGEFAGPWGTSASPVLVGDLLIQNCDAVDKAFLLAVNKKTGKTVWQTPRPKLQRGGWSTPVLVKSDDRQELVLNGEKAVHAYDPTSGKLLWFCKSFRGRGEPTVTPANGLVYVVNGQPADFYAVRPGGEGDVTKTHMAWHTPRRSGRDQPSPIVIGDHVIVLSMSGIATCYNGPTGKVLWSERLEGRFSSSPIAVAGLAYFQNESGETYVIEPGPKLKIVSRNKIGSPTEIFRASLTPSAGQMFIRSDKTLYCVKWNQANNKSAAKSKESTDWGFVPGNAVGVVSIRWSKVWRHEVVQKIRKTMVQETKEFTTDFERLGVEPDNVARLSIVISDVPQNQPIIHVKTIKPYNLGKVLKGVVPGAVSKKYLGHTIYHVPNRKTALLNVNKLAFVWGRTPEVFMYLDRLKEAKKGNLTKILNKQNASRTAFLALNISPVLKAAGGRLPPPLDSNQDLAKAKWLTASVNAAKKIDGRLTLQFANKEEAQNGQIPLQKGLKQLHELLSLSIKQLAKRPKGQEHFLKLLRDIERQTGKITVTRKATMLESSLQIHWDNKSIDTALAELVIKLRKDGIRRSSANNLQQLALAMHSYHDTNKRFPPAAVYDKNGKPLLSWRVLLLPYLNQDKLYRMFRLNEPWDSPHNKKLLARMPKVFAMPVGKHASNVTYYQAVVGKGTVFESRRGLSLYKITAGDGTSHTILFVEAKQGVPWTKPADVSYDPGKKMPPLGGHFSDGFHAVLCDGSAHFLASDVQPATLRLLFLWNDGMVVPLNVFE